MSPAGALLLVLGASLSSAVRLLSEGELRCPRQDLNCTASQSPCMDRTQLLATTDYTPAGPEELQVSVVIRADGAGQLHPALSAQWKMRDDGSIRFLKATELHLIVLSTNQNLCVRYTFKDKLPMRSPSGEKWSFSANMLLLDPGLQYRVSVFNIPKPKPHHTNYDVSKEVTVSDCGDPVMRTTQFCMERGSLWRPNISAAQLSADGAHSVLAVSFTPDTLCEEYVVIVSCTSIPKVAKVLTQDSPKSLNATFSLNHWPRSCCQFDVEIKPIFPKCGEDCTRVRRTVPICPEYPQPNASVVSPYMFVALGVPLMCIVIGLVVYFLSNKTGSPPVKIEPNPPQPGPPPKVLIIYSHDHYLYRDVVLKLCAFLQARCGTKVLVDMLDSTSVSMVGRLRWLECQRQQLKDPSDKVLVLCSRGVQAKWRAICGHGQVTLKEDVLSPTDDMLTPFLNLFLPNMHQAGMLGKYMVAYFEDIGSEEDVPSVFDISVKYSLMKHFEELFFRILDREKYQPGQVNHVTGIGPDEYFNCPAGGALKNAIETFLAYQLKHPDWFDKECLVNEEEILTEARPLMDKLQIPSVLEGVPVIRHGGPAYSQEVEINKDHNSIHIVAPEINPEYKMPSVAQVLPVINPAYEHHHLHSYSVSPKPVYVVEPVLNQTPSLHPGEEAFGPIPTENDEKDPHVWGYVHQSSHRSLTSRHSVDSHPSQASYSSTHNRCVCPPNNIHSQPMEMEENEHLKPSPKDPSNGSDQGYISKMSSQPDCPFREDPLVTLMRLQEKLFEQDSRHSDRDLEIDSKPALAMEL